MSVDLTRMDDGLITTFSNNDWSLILETAIANGWKPQGTFKIDDDGEEIEKWDTTDYQSNDGQGVRGTDAEAIAIALVKCVQGSNDNASTNNLFQQFINFAQIFDNGETYFPGFEIY